MREFVSTSPTFDGSDYPAINKPTMTINVEEKTCQLES